MTVVVKSAWKNKKNGDTVEYKGTQYVIGIDAFATVEAAAEAGRTNELVIVDKKLSSPVDGKNIESAATDIFESTMTVSESKDGKTETSTIKFKAAAGGTAVMENDSALTGFKKVAVTDADGVFFGGEQDFSLTEKQVDDPAKEFRSFDITASISTSATGSLAVTGESVSDPSYITVDGIPDSAGRTGQIFDVIGDIYKNASGNDDYEPVPVASYANVTLQNVVTDNTFNGGSITEKAMQKNSETAETKRSREYTDSLNIKTGSGSATFINASAGTIIGFKNVKITNGDLAGDLQVGGICGGSQTENYSLKKNFVKDTSFSSDFSSSLTTSVAGTLNATGWEDHWVKANGIDLLNSATLKNVQFSDPAQDAAYFWAESDKTTENISAAAQKGGDTALTYSYSENYSRAAKGTLTADASVLGALEGIKTVTATSTQFKSADATESKTTTTQKNTGFAVGGITEDMSLNDLDPNKSQTYEHTVKTDESSVGTATLTDVDAQGGDLSGFKTVNITRKKDESASGFGNIVAGNQSETISTKTGYDVDKSATYENSTKTTCAAAGTLTVIDSAKGDKLPIGGDVLNFSSVNLENVTVAGTIGMTDPSTNIDAKKVSVKSQGDSNTITVTTDQETTTTAVGSLIAKSSDLGALSYIKTVSITDSKFASAEANNIKNMYSTSGTGFTDAKLVPDVKNLDIKAIKTDQPFTTRQITKEENAVGGSSFKFAGKTTGEGNAVSIHGYKSVSLENSNADEKGVLIAGLQNRSTAAEEIKNISFDRTSSFRGDLKYKAHSKAVGDAVIKGYTAADVNWFVSVKVIGSDYETQLNGFVGKDTQTAQLTQFQTGKTIQGVVNTEYSVTNEWNVKGSESHILASTLEASKAVISGGCQNLKTVKLQNVIADGASFFNTGNSESNWSQDIKWLSNDPQDPEVNIVTSVDNWPYDDPVAEQYIKRVTYVDSTTGNTMKADGDFTLDNDENSSAENLFVSQFKNVSITLAAPTAVTVNTVSLDGDKTEKTAFKYRASEEEKSLDYNGSGTSTATGALKVTGRSTADGVTALNMTGNGLGFARITLKDAVIAGTDVVSESYVEKSSYTISESVAADGSASVKVTNTCSKTGNGKFTAAVANTVAGVPVTVCEGTLKGYGNISIKDVSIGNADNFKRGGASRYVVPVSGKEYFDVYAYNKTEPWPAPRPDGTEVLEGDITGAYTLTRNGDVDSFWTVTTSAATAGSFTQEARIAGAAAGNISGYDKVTLTGVATVESINGVNSIDSSMKTYKTANGEVVTDTVVTTETETSAASVKLTGKKIGDAMQPITVGSISGYKSVSLDNASVGTVEADDSKYVETVDNLTGHTTTNYAWASVGTLSATDSIIGGGVDGFQTVKLTNTVAAVDFIGTSVTSVEDTDKLYPLSFENKATGSFTAQYNGKDSEAGFAVGIISGYKQIKLTDYSAGNIRAGGTLLDSYVNSLKFTPNDEKNGSLGVLNISVATKGYSFSATAKVNTAMTVGDVEYYGKVEAYGLKSIGSVVNANRADDARFDKRKYSNLHYGDGSMTEDIYSEAIKITAMNIDASAASVTIRGTAAKNGVDAKPTAVTGYILGYGKVTLSDVIVGGNKPVVYAAGKYAFISKTDKDGKFIGTSTNTAAGKLSISSAKAVEDATFAVEGFKNVSIDITGEGTAAPFFTSIIGGIETAQLTNGHLDYTTYAVSGTLDVATIGGTVDYVAGFEKVNLKDTDAGTIAGYAITAKKDGNEWEQAIVGKSAVTFENTASNGNTVAAVDNAKTVTFKAADDVDVDFYISSILSSENFDIDVLIEKCQTAMDFQSFALNDGDEIKLTSTGAFGDGTWSTILFDGLTEDTLDAYFDNIEGASFTGKGTLLAAVTEDQFKTAAEGKVEIGKDIAFQSLLA